MNRRQFIGMTAGSAMIATTAAADAPADPRSLQQMIDDTPGAVGVLELASGHYELVDALRLPPGMEMITIRGNGHVVLDASIPAFFLTIDADRDVAIELDSVTIISGESTQSVVGERGIRQEGSGAVVALIRDCTFLDENGNVAVEIAGTVETDSGF